MGREGCAAQSYQAAVSDSFDKIIFCLAVRDLKSLPRFLTSVGRDDDKRICAAHRRTAFLYGYYFAGNTRMNRSAHRSIDIADPLTDFDQVALFYQGLTGPSDVL